MDLREQMVSSETIFEGKIIKVALDQARLPDGALAAREVVYHPGGVAVLALECGVEPGRLEVRGPLPVRL